MQYTACYTRLQAHKVERVLYSRSPQEPIKLQVRLLAERFGGLRTDPPISPYFELVTSLSRILVLRKPRPITTCYLFLARILHSGTSLVGRRQVEAYRGPSGSPILRGFQTRKTDHVKLPSHRPRGTGEKHTKKEGCPFSSFLVASVSSNSLAKKCVQSERHKARQACLAATWSFL